MLAAYSLAILGYPELRYCVVCVQTRLAYDVVRVFELATSVPSVTAFGAMLRGLTVRWFVSE